ncbi:MAG: HsdR family type I site-specific deoxyribonuclease [Planctomycetaceae bacterium]|nr:HsdR family type I site-specific deoxyribonuclease [Planctomycetaceae bacterium]
MTIGGERSAVQNPFLKYAKAAGWTYLTPEEALAKRRGLTSPVLDSVLIDQLQALNPGIVGLEQAENLRDQIVRVRPTIEGNFDAWEFLKGLKTVFVEVEKRERNVRLFHPTDLTANQFHVTDEFTFSNGTPPDVRTDVMLFINGFPVIVGETKSAKKRDGIALAFDDIRYYHKEGAELLAIMQLHCLTHLVQFYYGATWNLTRKGLFNWRDEAAGNYESLVKTFVDRNRVLQVVNEFILFTRKDGDLEKSVLRPHQMRAVERSVQRAKEPDKRRGLIWHTQGSGKTYTMITTATRLIEDPAFSNPTVLMLVDRNELESQLFGNLAATLTGNVKPVKKNGYTEFGPYCIADNKKGLRTLLAADRRGLIVSMIHKFDDIPANICTRDNVFVLVDEAHRSTGGDLGNYLMGALPNATYLGFTGTPIDQTAYGKGTFKVFGTDDEKGYLDKYSIKESVEDKTTVPLHYQLAPNDLLVDRETLEKEFLELADAEGVSDIEELNKVLDRAVTLKNMLKNEERVDKLAKFVAEHYLSTIEPMGYKAFLVAVDREGCALLKEALDKYLPPEYSEVVMSSAGKKDSEKLRKYQLSEDDEKAVRKKFRKPEEQPKILIVTEKLLTGFDAPVLYCMYLDKPMRDHVLLQAIARVNRPYEDEDGRRKPCGFVLDFVGIFEKLEKALAFDSKDVEGVIEGLDVLKKRFEDQMQVGRQKYLTLTKSHKGDKAVEALLEHFRDKEPREEFYNFFRELEELHEIISPDQFMRPFIDDFTELASMYELVRGAYDRGISMDKEFMRKTAKLVRKNTQTSGIGEPTKLQKLNAEMLQAIADGDEPDTVKVFNLLKAIDQLTREEANKEPYLLSIGEKAEQIAAAFEDRQQNTKDTLSGLEKLIQEYMEARKQREATELSPESFAVFWLLKQQGVEKADDVAKAAAEAFEQNPHWQSSSHQEQEVRKSFYKALISAGVDGVVEVAQNILKMLKGVGK